MIVVHAMHISVSGRNFVSSVYQYAINADEKSKNHILGTLCAIGKGAKNELDVFRRLGYLENVNDLNKCGFIDTKSFLCRMVYNYANYDMLTNYTTLKGLHLKESRAAYEEAILKTLIDVIDTCDDFEQALDKMGELIP